MWPRALRRAGHADALPRVAVAGRAVAAAVGVPGHRIDAERGVVARDVPGDGVARPADEDAVLAEHGGVDDVVADRRAGAVHRHEDAAEEAVADRRAGVPVERGAATAGIPAEPPAPHQGVAVPREERLVDDGPRHGAPGHVVEREVVVPVADHAVAALVREPGATPRLVVL